MAKNASVFVKVSEAVARASCIAESANDTEKKKTFVPVKKTVWRVGVHRSFGWKRITGYLPKLTLATSACVSIDCIALWKELSTAGRDREAPMA